MEDGWGSDDQGTLQETVEPLPKQLKIPTPGETVELAYGVDSKLTAPGTFIVTSMASSLCWVRVTRLGSSTSMRFDLYKDGYRSGRTGFILR